MKIKFTFLLAALFTSLTGFAQVTVQNLNIDTTLTGFHYAANFQGTIVYTPNGKPDINTINPSAFSFSILPNGTCQIALSQIEMLMSMSKRDGYKQTDIESKDTLIDGNKAYYTCFTETHDGMNYKNRVFDAFIIKNGVLLLFVSGDLDNGKYIENFKKTFYAAKF